MTRPRTRNRLALLAVACAVTVIVVSQLPANAIVVTDTPTPVTGNSTYFDGLGSPYGGCGLPQADLETQDFIALNVYHTPNDYQFYPRPVTDPAKVGMWNNGKNCGRWVQVKVSDYCTGVNDGAPGQAFCRNGNYVADQYNDAVLNMIVADSCGDANAWCRDDPYHIDLSKPSLGRFVKNGTTVNLLPNNFNNRKMTWQFIPAPNYTGDIQIGFLQGAERWWPAISVSRLANGIHGVEYFANGAWVTAQMNSDMGQSFIIGGTVNGGTDFQIRVRDANDALINGGRVYNFSLPCATRCTTAYTRVSYTTSGGGPTSAPPTTPPTTRPTTAPTTPPTTRPTTPPTTRPTTPPTTRATTPPTTSGGACTAAYRVAGQWQGSFQGEVTVTAGTAPVNGWTVTWTFANGQAISQIWGATQTATAPVTIKNAAWNGSLGANASTTFGFIASWSGTNSVPVVTCTSP